MGSVPKSRLGIASGLLAMIRSLGMVTGTAIFCTAGVLTSLVRAQEKGRTPDTEHTVNTSEMKVK